MNDANVRQWEKQRTDEAWKRLMQRLEDEAPHPRWEMWEKNHSNGKTGFEISASERQMPLTALTASALSDDKHRDEPATAKKGPKETLQSPLLLWGKARMKWLAAAAAAVLAAILLISPKGNDVLAAFLNQFRMEQMTVVEGEELRRMFEQMVSSGVNEESITRFGEFRHTTGPLEGSMSVDAAKEKLGWNLAVLPGFDVKKDEVHISPSHSFDLKINVEEVNAAMKRLGAETLLPEEVDGKTISLHIGETVSMYVDGKKEYRYLMQTPVPSVTVSEGIPMEKALEAVMRFPLLPDSLKQSLSQANVLESGAVPLPFVADGETKKIRVNGTEVLLTKHRADRGAHFEATWIRDGFLYQLGGHYTDEQELQRALAGLIRP